MGDHPATALMQLGESDQELADPGQDVRGFQVVDGTGEKLGRVHDLLIDLADKRVRMLRVDHGGVLGFGATHSFLPVEAIVGIEPDQALVRVDQARDTVADSPRYQPELTDRADYYTDIYNYYGYPPYWSSGYSYPAFPLYGHAHRKVSEPTEVRPDEPARTTR